MDEKMKTEVKLSKEKHVDENQGKESEVTQPLKESINDAGMDIGSARIECTAKPITHAFIFTSKTMQKETNSSGQRIC